jgi:asparagine synthase (glutamine-hydrolysing)
MKALNEDCVRFEIFPPGHLYSSAAAGFRRWYNPAWFLEQVPATPYDPLVLRAAFEKVRAVPALPHSVVLFRGNFKTAVSPLLTLTHVSPGGREEAHD